MRALVKYLDGVSDQDIVGLNIPTGIPLVYELDAELKPLAPLLPGRPGERSRPRCKAVAAQGKAERLNRHAARLASTRAFGARCCICAGCALLRRRGAQPARQTS